MTTPCPCSIRVESNREWRDEQIGNYCTESLCHPVNILRYPLVSAQHTYSISEKNYYSSRTTSLTQGNKNILHQYNVEDRPTAISVIE